MVVKITPKSRLINHKKITRKETQINSTLWCSLTSYVTAHTTVHRSFVNTSVVPVQSRQITRPPVLLLEVFSRIEKILMCISHNSFNSKFKLIDSRSYFRLKTEASFFQTAPTASMFVHDVCLLKTLTPCEGYRDYRGTTWLNINTAVVSHLERDRPKWCYKSPERNSSCVSMCVAHHRSASHNERKKTQLLWGIYWEHYTARPRTKHASSVAVVISTSEIWHSAINLNLPLTPCLRIDSHTGDSWGCTYRHSVLISTKHKVQLRMMGSLVLQVFGHSVNQSIGQIKIVDGAGWKGRGSPHSWHGITAGGTEDEINERRSSSMGVD